MVFLRHDQGQPIREVPLDLIVRHLGHTGDVVQFLRGEGLEERRKSVEPGDAAPREKRLGQFQKEIGDPMALQIVDDGGDTRQRTN